MTPNARAETLVVDQPCLDVRQVSISINRTRIVSNISFAARAGELLAIIGPSGSGKTTLLKALTGETAYSGQIRLAGGELRTISSEQQARFRGVLPQASSLSFPLTVAEVVGLGVLDLKLGRRQRELRINDALLKVGLAGFGGRSYQELSGGEQQRVQLARVLCQVWHPVSEGGMPRWLFLDEPVSSLDIKHQYQIMQLAADFARRGGGVVAVLHDLNLTAAFAHQVMVMKSGRMVSKGSQDEILQADALSDVYGIPLDTLQRPDGRTYLTPAAMG